MAFFSEVFLFVFGTAIGSFLNVIALRYREEERLLSKNTIGGRSFCVFCRSKLRWYELIPLLSFLIQRGKCNHCGRKISRQYPAVEFLSGLIFIFIPYVLYSLFYVFVPAFHIYVFIAVWILIFELFLLLSLIDFRLSIIPDSINLTLVVLGTFLLIFESSLNYSAGDGLSRSFFGHYALLFGFNNFNSLTDNLIINRLFASFLGMFFFGLIILISRGRGMGMGDFKLIGALGLIFGWPDILMVIILSFVSGTLFIVPFLARGTKKMKDAVPFGPFIVIGAALTFFLGFEIIDGYFKLFGL